MKNLSSVLNFWNFNGTFECQYNKNTLCIKGIRPYCVSALGLPPAHVGKKWTILGSYLENKVKI